MHPVITLTTDFGLNDPYVGIMKGVILNIAPDAQLVDLTHQIRPQNILQAALVVKTAHSYFPKGTVHVVVVDPGVGGVRRPIGIKNNGYWFVGPDNGVFTSVIDSQALCYELTAEKYFLKDVSTTFHGRDIFSPVAAWLAQGKTLRAFGHKIADPETLDWPLPKFDGKTISGEVIYVDHFGNLTTNIDAGLLEGVFEHPESLEVQLARKTLKGPVNSYSEAREGSPGVIINSWHALEIFYRENNAAEKLKVKIGTPVRVTQAR
ncbi:SAM hydrolase/SAM-dependent halogenase family protein [Nitrospina watsonii]|uniref:S-adenosyl-L-methionine hydrolase (Adenosine-forming) n=1 Tax=Nitrospina watsonii TaxID=1323948 RepID=A0ABM9HC93_9BACT|nr:SAM-dependent chlorinase/fluorinase [Nitrospina watsonii]CAI2717859.1 putative S-adenosyl-L-methionine hydrolase (adenosine-forming) [Nitrospina watsonii]